MLGVAGLGASSLARQLLAARRTLRRLPPARRRLMCGVAVTLLRDRTPRAFCAGLLRPRVCVSEGAVALLSRDELRPWTGRGALDAMGPCD